MMLQPVFIFIVYGYDSSSAHRDRNATDPSLGRMLQQAQRADPPANLASTQATIRVDSVRRGAEKVNTTKTVTSTRITKCEEEASNTAWAAMFTRANKSIETSYYIVTVETSFAIQYLPQTGASDAEKAFWNCTALAIDGDSDGYIKKIEEFCPKYNHFETVAHNSTCNATYAEWLRFHHQGFAGRPVLAIVLGISLQISW